LHVMSAELPAKRPKRPKAEIYKQLEDNEMERMQAMRNLRRELPWKDWLLLDFLRYWYWLAIVTLEAFLILSLIGTYHVKDILGDFLLVAIAALITGLGYFGYRILWPQGGFTRLEVMTRTLRRLRGKRKRFE